MDALEQIIEAEKEFIRQYGEEPRKVFIPHVLAMDLMKLPRSRIGSISEEYNRKGLRSLQQLHGMEVEITYEDSLRLE